MFNTSGSDRFMVRDMALNGIFSIILLAGYTKPYNAFKDMSLNIKTSVL